MQRPETRLLFTCEHGGNQVPKALEPLFARQSRKLASHRGWDPGALPIARTLARVLRAPLLSTTMSRLVVDMNRSPNNPRVFSETTRSLSREQRNALLLRYHGPHWNRVTEAIEERAGRVVHIAVHSFTPVLNGSNRAFDVGLLYDPKRAVEVRFAKCWQRGLQQQLGSTRVRRNAPYRGDSDGLTTALRKTYAMPSYLGLELELNQSALERPAARRVMSELLIQTLRVALCESGLGEARSYDPA